MNKQFKQDIYKKTVQGIRKSCAWMRLTCALCMAVLLLTSCIGCNSLVSVEELDAVRNGLREEINVLESDNEAALRKIESLKNDNEAAQQEIDVLKCKNETAEREIDALKDSNEAAEREIDALKDSNEAAEREIKSLKDDNEAAQQEIDRLKEQIQKLEQQIASGEPSEKIRIYVDQGHNPTSYHNAGASGNGLYEQDLTFAIGCLLAQLLEDDGRFEVCLSRPTASTVLGTDNASSLAARVEGAQEFGADYFISLHINSFGDESVRGIEVFVAEQGSTSYAFGNSLLQGLLDATGLGERGMKINPDLHVLKNATMPAALLEMGFISNPEDAALLSQSPELFAQGIYDGILAYFDLPSQNGSMN